MSGMIIEGMKLRVDEHFYVVDAVQQNSLSKLMFLSPLDAAQKKIGGANVKVLSHQELARKINNNEASFYDQSTSHLTGVPFLSDKQIKDQEMWHSFVVDHLARHSKNYTSNANIDESRMLFDWNKFNSKCFSKSTCQAKVKAYLDSDKDPRKLINYDAASCNKGKKRFTQETEDIIYDFFMDYYLVRSDKTAKSTNKICDLICIKVKQLNKEDPVKYPKVPSKSSIYRRLADIEAEMVINRTISKQKQKGLRYKLGREYIGEEPLERVEMDAVYINLGIKSETRTYLGTLAVMFAIDTCTRCIVGYSIKVGKKVSESSDLAIECLKNIVMPKENIDWPCNGIPTKLYSDATTATKGNGYKIMALGLGIMPLVTVSYSPWSKPFIESFFRTLRREFLSRLPGYLGSKTRVNNAHLEQGETAEQHASMTLQEFDEELQKFITQTYHTSGHGGLNQRAPIDVWQKKVSENPLLICEPSPKFIPEHFRGGVSMNHTLYKNGSIKLKNEQYANSELKELSMSGVEKVDCFYSDIDTRSIVVRADKTFVIVPIRAKSHHDEVGFQQAELDVARIGKFNDISSSPRKHYSYKKVTRGLNNFQKMKAKQAENKEHETGRKKPNKLKFDNTKSIDMNDSNARDQIMNAVRAAEADESKNSTMPEFNVGDEL